MKKILFVSHTLDFAAGGAERVLFDVLKRIDPRRFGVSLAAARDLAGVPRDFEDLGRPIHQLPRLPMLSSRNPWSLIRVAIALLGCAISLWRLLRSEPFDLIHVNSIFALHFALLPCLLTRTPLVFHEHGLPRDRESSVWAIAYSWLIHRVTHTVAITHAVEAEVLSYGVAPESITTVHNGIDPEPPASIDEPDSARSPADVPGFTIVQIANLLDWKGQDVVLKSLARLRGTLPDARVVFYGRSVDPAFEARLRDRVVELKLSDCVEFGGFRTDLGGLLPSFDCLVVASRAEPFGLVLLEAMRAGVPVIASNAGGVPEIVTDGVNGLLFEPGDVAGLAEAFGRIAEDPALAKQLTEEGNQVVRTRFSLERQVNSLESLFDECAGRAEPDR